MTRGTPDIDRRRHPRYELFAQVHVHGEREDSIMELVNISLSGALIHMGGYVRPDWLAVGQRVEMAITNPDSLALVQLEGIVRRVMQMPGLGFAVEFAGSDEETTRALKGLVTLAAKSASPGGPPPVPKAR